MLDSLFWVRVEENQQLRPASIKTEQAARSTAAWTDTAAASPTFTRLIGLQFS